MKYEQAEQLRQRSLREGIGFIELAQIAEANGRDSTLMRNRALEVLNRFIDNDDAIEALYDADMRAKETDDE